MCQLKRLGCYDDAHWLNRTNITSGTNNNRNKSETRTAQCSGDAVTPTGTQGVSIICCDKKKTMRAVAFSWFLSFCILTREVKRCRYAMVSFMAMLSM